VALTGGPKLVGRSFQDDAQVCAALQGRLTPEGLLYFYEARTRVGMLGSVADGVGKATKAATSLIMLCGIVGRPLSPHEVFTVAQ